MYAAILMTHILCATIWTGGHLVLALTVLPKALRNKSPEAVIAFESGFEKIALPALFVQVITGLWLSNNLLGDSSQWFNMKNPLSHLVLGKLMLLSLTLIIAMHARIWLMPKLQSHGLSKAFVFHILSVTVLSVLFVVVGVLFRTGGF